MPDRIQEFDGLRGLMSLWVVVGHVLASGGLSSEPFWAAVLLHNVWAVGVFILLSGFVIHTLLSRSAENYAHYLFRRGMRLFPVYLACLLASVALLDVMVAAVLESPFEGPRVRARALYLLASQENFWPHLAAHLPLLQGLVPEPWLPQSSFAFVGQAWSVTLEWQFYLVAPLLMLLFRRSVLLGTVAMLLGWVATRKLLGGTMSLGFLGWSLNYFLLGILSSIAWQRRASWPSRVPGGRAAVCAVLALAGLAVIVLVPPFGIWLLFMAGLFGRAWWPDSRWAAAFRRAFANRAALNIGDRSYSIYMVHMIPLLLACFAANRMGLGGLGYLGLVMVVTLAGTWALTECLHRWIELPGIAAGKRWGRPARAQMSTGASGHRTVAVPANGAVERAG